MALSERTNPGNEGLPPEEERALVARAQQGDGAAMDHLLSAHQDQVYRTALRLMKGREDDAWELAQEVLVSAFRHIAQFRKEARFSTWLYRITMNLAKNRYVVENREKARYTSLDATSDEEDDRPQEFADGGVDARTLAGDRQMVQILQARLANLEPEWREMIVLRYFEEKSYEEIAEVLELPLGTVKSRINRARAALRDEMKDLLDGRGR